VLIDVLKQEAAEVAAWDAQSNHQRSPQSSPSASFGGGGGGGGQPGRCWSDSSALQASITSTLSFLVHRRGTVHARHVHLCSTIETLSSIVAAISKPKVGGAVTS
jgi:hypothetical protein